MNPERAQARADDLATRLASRLAREEQLSALPPVVAGAALVVPAGLLARLRGDEPQPIAPFALERHVVEQRAVDASVAAEEALGHLVTVMPPCKPGFDLRSETPDGGLRFVEVKGRIAGGETFMVTRNEILHALKCARCLGAGAGRGQPRRSGPRPDPVPATTVRRHRPPALQHHRHHAVVAGLLAAGDRPVVTDSREECAGGSDDTAPPSQLASR